MAAAKKPWQRILECCIFFLLLPGAGTLPCGNLTVDSSVIHLGATVTASCTLQKNHCPILEDEEIQITWKVDDHFLQGALQNSSNGVEVSNITIGPLNRTMTCLGCYVLRKKRIPQIMHFIQIHAGYPPSQPKNLTCIMDIMARNLMCQWDPGEDSFLPVNVTLKSSISRRDCEVHLKPMPDCIPQAGQNSCSIPRHDLQLYQKMIFWVTVQNALGYVESEPLCADPMDLVRLNPPTLQAIQSIPEETDCVSVTWEAAKENAHMKQLCELRFRMEGNREWTPVHNITSPIWKTQHCGFLFGMFYQFQMRCKKHLAGYWSDWSPAKNFTTHEKVPSGELVTWWKMKPRDARKEITEVQLLWKPMKPNEAKGKILGYRVTRGNTQYGGKESTLCNTTETHCNFSLPPYISRVYLTAYNAKGPSQPTEVFLLGKKGLPVPKMQATPHNENSIWVHWDLPRTSTTSYVIEWKKVTSAYPSDNDDIAWTKIQSGDITHALIEENIEPYQKYNISIYPLYGDQVGMPQYIEAYTKQKAPAEAPKLHPESISKSTAKLRWDPIPVEMQNGFITSYTIFWIGISESMNSAVVNASANAFTITGLGPLRMYKVHIMASTLGGNTNGTILTLYTKAMDDMDASLVYVIIGLLLFMIICLVICFQKSKRMKTQLWPSVPDPANSSLGRWAPAILQEEIQPPKACEVSPVIVSAALLFDTNEKKCFSCKKNETANDSKDKPTTFPELYGHDTKVTLPTTGTKPTFYVNGLDSIQYVQVFGGGYRGQQEELPSFYVRTNSTQPLLDGMTPSPKPYENLWFHSDQPSGKDSCDFQENAVFLEDTLMNFPLLHGLKIDGEENLSNSH